MRAASAATPPAALIALSSGVVSSTIPRFKHSRVRRVNTDVSGTWSGIPGMDSIATRLVFARTLRGFVTQDALAKAAGVSQSTIGNIEAGGKRKGLPSLPDLAETLRVRHRWLRDGDEPMELQSTPWPFPGIEPERIRRLTAEQRLEVQGAIRTVLAEFERGDDSGPAPLAPLPTPRPRPDIGKHR